MRVWYLHSELANFSISTEPASMRRLSLVRYQMTEACKTPLTRYSQVHRYLHCPFCHAQPANTRKYHCSSFHPACRCISQQCQWYRQPCAKPHLSHHPVLTVISTIKEPVVKRKHIHVGCFPTWRWQCWSGRSASIAFDTLAPDPEKPPVCHQTDLRVLLFHRRLQTSRRHRR